MSVMAPVFGAGARAWPHESAFTVSGRPEFQRVQCPLCRSTGATWWASYHAKKVHELCTCGRWFVSLPGHFGQLERHGVEHRAILTRGGSEV